jgi:hypothetical protein
MQEVIINIKSRKYTGKMKKPPVGSGTFCPSPMPEISSGMEECKIPAWARDKMFRHQGPFLFSDKIF